MRIIFLLHFLIITTSHAIETCSRTAYVNYQKVLVDTSSANKGEGLRFYIGKDEKAVALLNEYQEKNRPSTVSTFFSSFGGSMVLGGLIYSSLSEEKTTANHLIYAGLGIVGLNFFITRIKQYNSEPYLERSVREYNKRNTPKIYFTPNLNAGKVGIGLGASQEF